MAPSTLLFQNSLPNAVLSPKAPALRTALLALPILYPMVLSASTSEGALPWIAFAESLVLSKCPAKFLANVTAIVDGLDNGLALSDCLAYAIAIAIANDRSVEVHSGEGGISIA